LLDALKELEMNEDGEVQLRLMALEFAIKYFNEHLENEGDLFSLAEDIVTFLKGTSK
jgi:hypothetical protein